MAMQLGHNTYRYLRAASASGDSLAARRCASAPLQESPSPLTPRQVHWRRAKASVLGLGLIYCFDVGGARRDAAARREENRSIRQEAAELEAELETKRGEAKRLQELLYLGAKASSKRRTV